MLLTWKHLIRLDCSPIEPYQRQTSCGIPSISWLALFISLTVEAQVYKWTDAEGKVHYGNQPPPTDVFAAESLNIRSQPTPPGGVDNIHDLQRATERQRELRAARRGFRKRCAGRLYFPQKEQ